MTLCYSIKNWTTQGGTFTESDWIGRDLLMGFDGMVSDRIGWDRMGSDGIG